MDIILDGVILDITIEDEKNIGDILRALGAIRIKLCNYGRNKCRQYSYSGR